MWSCIFIHQFHLLSEILKNILLNATDMCIDTATAIPFSVCLLFVVLPDNADNGSRNLCQICVAHSAC